MHLCYTQENNMQEAAADGTNDRQARAHFGIHHPVHARERIFSFRARNLRGRGSCVHGDGPLSPQRSAAGGLHQHGRQKEPDHQPAGPASDRKIPVVGVVTAGVPILAVENIEGYLPWDGDESCFALRVRGDSMINAGILSGDKVVVRPQKTAENGQIVVALLDDSATVKRFHREKGKVWLLPENPAYEPIDGTDCSILGLVKAVVREY